MTQVVNDACQCDFQKSYISPAVLLCDQEEPTRIVYRARIASYGNHSANQLVGYIEDWVKEGATITTGVSLVMFDSDCPVRIGDVSDPVCTPTLSPSAPLTVVVIATCVIVAAIAVLVTIAVIIIILVCLIKQKNKR